MMGKRFLFVIVGVLVLLALTTTVVWAADGDTNGGGTTGATDVLVQALAPIIAIATAIERILEMFWERWEKAGVWPNKKGVPDTGDLDYIARKKAGSHWLGTLCALIAIGLTNARFFRLLGLDVGVLFSGWVLFSSDIGGIFGNFTIGALIDWVMTATIIGWGGTELTHSIIEGLVRGRNLWKEMREVEAGRKSILDAKFFNDYIAPELEKRSISVAALKQAFEGLKTVGVPVDEFIGSMTIGKVDDLLTEIAGRPGGTEASQAVRALFEGVPPERAVEVPDILALLTPEQRKRFLGA
jgi:hypothetical protein